jgi:hypothetical protein
MTNRVTWRLATVAAALLAAGTARAGYQATRSVGWLATGDRYLCESQGQVYLEELSYSESPYSVRGGHTRWSVSAPAISTGKAGRGMKLGYDTKGRNPKVRLVTEKSKDKSAEGASARWAFEIVEYLKPQRELVRRAREEEEVLVGEEGITFRARATDGPYKGWYLATKDDGQGKKRLVLVREKKNAAVFKYVGTYYYAKKVK